MSTTLRLGTRGSPLALTQSNMVKDALEQNFSDITIELIIIKTSGDWLPEHGEVRLKEEDGGKGQFAKEIEAALLAGEIDLAVHSMKDMETTLPVGLIIEHMLPREDPRDVLLFNNLANINQKIPTMEHDTIVGTASVRRQAFLLAQNQNLNIVPFRGNVQTRIDKLKAGDVHLTLLALAGLKRLGLEKDAHRILDMDEMLPAAGQGAVGIEIHQDNIELYKMLDEISCRETVLCVTAERAALRVLDGSCHTPIGAHAALSDQEMSMQVKIASLDGTEIFEDCASAQIADIAQADDFGAALGQSLKSKTPPRLLLQKIEES